MAKKQLAQPQPFVVKRSRIQGRGGFATRDIRKGERVVEYVGERISWKEADRRYDDDGMGRHHTFLFAVTSRTVIDGAVDGNDSRFINHACDPNCEAVDERGKIFIEAIRPIAAGDELFYDYAYARDKTTTDEDEALYRCRCGSPKCRGTILEQVKKKARLPKTHHVAARHPHEHADPAAKHAASAPGSGASTSRGRAKKKSAKKKNATKKNATKKNATKKNATKKNATKKNATTKNATTKNATTKNATTKNATTKKNSTSVRKGGARRKKAPG